VHVFANVLQSFLTAWICELGGTVTHIGRSVFLGDQRHQPRSPTQGAVPSAPIFGTYTTHPYTPTLFDREIKHGLMVYLVSVISFVVINMIRLIRILVSFTTRA